MPDPADFSWHDSYIAAPSEGDSVPDLINNTVDIVEGMFDLNRGWAQEAINDSKAAIAELKNAKGPPTLAEPPKLPDINTKFTVATAFEPGSGPDLGTLSTEAVVPFSAIDIEIPDIASELPDYVPLITGVSIPAAPIFTAPAFPLAPGVDTTFDLPTAPTADYGSVPDLSQITIPTYTPVVIPLFNDAAPEFDVMPPDPFLNWTEPQYNSDIRDAVKLVLQQMLAGGTGLAPAVELAIWERGAGREDTAADREIATATDEWARRGYDMPPGALNAQVLALLDAKQRKSAELSREVMVKQAELEQTNRQFAVDKGIGYEQVFVGLFIQVVDRNFQIAKFGVETQIQIFNLRVTAFNVQQAVFAQKVERFRVQLEAAFAELKAFEAQVNAAKAQAEINVALVQLFQAKVSAFDSQVKAYTALIQGQSVKAELEKNKVDLYGKQIDGVIGVINGKRAEFEAYSARVSAEASKVNLEEASARAYAARVQGMASKADIAIKRVDAQIQSNRLNLDWSVADLNRITTMRGQDLAVIQANAATYNAVTQRAAAKYSADLSAHTAEIQAVIEAGRLGVARYAAMLEVWKTQAAQVMQTYSINAESLKALGQISSNLAAGAMAGTHVSAGISGGAAASQSKSVSEGRSKTFQQTVSDSTGYQINHNFNHEV